MVHEKYIKVGGKLYGPYYYESYREDGKVKKRYVKVPPGGSSPVKKKKVSGFNFVKKSRVKNLFLGILATVAVVFVLFFAMQGVVPSGQVVSDIETDYEIGEALTGSLRYNLAAGELLPVDSMVVVSLGSESKEIKLSDLVSAESKEGDFYVSNIGLDGSGLGYGVVGTRTSYPVLDFEFEVFTARRGVRCAFNGRVQ